MYRADKRPNPARHASGVGRRGFQDEDGFSPQNSRRQWSYTRPRNAEEEEEQRAMELARRRRDEEEELRRPWGRRLREASSDSDRGSERFCCQSPGRRRCPSESSDDRRRRSPPRLEDDRRFRHRHEDRRRYSESSNDDDRRRHEYRGRRSPTRSQDRSPDRRRHDYNDSHFRRQQPEECQCPCYCGSRPQFDARNSYRQEPRLQTFREQRPSIPAMIQQAYSKIHNAIYTKPMRLDERYDAIVNVITDRYFEEFSFNANFYNETLAQTIDELAMEFPDFYNMKPKIIGQIREMLKHLYNPRYCVLNIDFLMRYANAYNQRR